MKVVLIHGKDTDPAGKWYPWFGNEVMKMGHEYIAPSLPHSNDPILDEWLAEIHRSNPDQNTILVGHSRGGVAILRWFERQPPEKQVKKAILVATNSGRLADKAIASESNYGFYTESGYNFEKIKEHCKNFVVLHSKDDPWVPFSAGETNARGLSARFLVFDTYGHFGKNAPTIPELIQEIRVA